MSDPQVIQFAKDWLKKTGHALASPSSAHRWINCHGAPQAEAQYADKEGDAAAEGSGAHCLFAQCWTDDVNPMTFLDFEIGEVIRDEFLENQSDKVKAVVIDEAMVGHIQVFIERIKELAGDNEVYIERRVYYDDIVPEGSGPADVMFVVDKTLYIVDLKYGAGLRVEAVGAPQIRLYGYGAVRYVMEDLMEDIDDVELCIYQPRNFYNDPLRSENMTVEDLTEWVVNEAGPAGNQVYTTNPGFKAGSWCHFCKHKRCPTRHESVIKQLAEDAGTDIDSLIAVDEEEATVNKEVVVVTAPAATFPAPQTLTLEQLGRIAANADKIRAYAKEIKDYAEKLAQAGDEIPYNKLVKTNGRAGWKDPEAALKAARRYDEGKDWTMDQMAPRKTIGIGAMKAMMGKDHRLFKNHVVTSGGGIKLVALTDKREAVLIELKRDEINEEVEIEEGLDHVEAQVVDTDDSMWDDDVATETPSESDDDMWGVEAPESDDPWE